MITPQHITKLRQLIDQARPRRMDVGVTPDVLAALLEERDEMIAAIDQALDIFIETGYPADEGVPALLRAALDKAGDQ